jgi:hypothetical protein
MLIVTNVIESVVLTLYTKAIEHGSKQKQLPNPRPSWPSKQAHPTTTEVTVATTQIAGWAEQGDHTALPQHLTIVLSRWKKGRLALTSTLKPTKDG